MKWRLIGALALMSVLQQAVTRDVCGNADACISMMDAAVMLVDNPEVNNHFYLGGMFGVHERGPNAYTKGAVKESGIQHLEMFFYAIKNNRLFDNNRVKVGGIAFDSGSRDQQTVENVLGFESCKVPYGLENTTFSQRIEPRYVLAYVGPETSEEAAQTGRILADLKKTQVTNTDSPVLENRELYGYLLRTMPSASLATKAMVAQMLLKDWKYAIVVYSDTAYGRGLLDSFKSDAEEKDVCVVGELRIPVQYSTTDMKELIEDMLKMKSAYVVAVLAEDMYAMDLMKELGSTPNVRGAFVFLGSSSWNTNPQITANANNVADGAITFAPRINRYITDTNSFKTYFSSLKPDQNTWNPWFNEYWMQKFQCQLPAPVEQGLYPRPCTGAETLDRVDFDRELPATYLAVDVILQGAQDAIINAQCNNSVCSHLLNPDNSGTQIFEGISKAVLKSTPVFDTTTGGPPINELSYNIYNLQVDSSGQNPIYQVVGTYDASLESIRNPRMVVQYASDGEMLDNPVSSCPNQICCNEPPVTTPAPTTSSAAPSTTTDPTQGGKFALLYVDASVEVTGAFPSEQNRTQSEMATRFETGSVWVIALGVLAGLGILAVIIFEIYIMTLILPNRSTRQLRSMWLGQLLLFGIFLSYLTLFAFIFTPTTATCGITRFGVGVSYSICYSVLLVKLMVIMTSKNTEGYIPGDGESPNYLKGTYQLLLFLFAVGVQIVIDIQWLIQVPPGAVKVISNGAQQVWICNHYTWKASVIDGMTSMSTFVRTEFENHILSLIYVMLLIAITTALALKAHGITTNHRESIFIGIAAGFSIPIWLAWTLVGSLNSGSAYAHEYGDACLAFGLFITASLILFAMFLPKVRQLVNMGVEGIYLEDDRETIYGSMYNGLPPPSYKSVKGPGSIIYVNNSTDSLHRVHPRTHSVYSAPVAYTRRPESVHPVGNGSKVLTVTSDLNGKTVLNGRHPQSEIAYPTARSVKSERSEKGTMRRSRSQQNLGAL